MPTSRNEVTLWCFDIAQRTGWAVCGAATDWKLVSGVWRLATGTVDIGVKGVALWRKLTALEKQFGPPDIFGFEQPLMPNGKGKVTIHTARPGIALCGVAETWATIRKAQIRELPASSWRSHFIPGGGRRGRKSADLKLSVQEECKRLGFDPKDDNEADVIGQMDYLLHVARIQPDWRLTL